MIKSLISDDDREGLEAFLKRALASEICKLIFMETVKEILPFTKPCSGAVVIPGSKSISNRALLLSCFSQNQVTLHGVLKSQMSN